MRGTGNVFRHGDSIAIEIRAGEASLRPSLYTKVYPTLSTETRGHQFRANRLRENYVGTRELRWSARLGLARFIWLIWFVLFIRLIWFIWLVSFNQKTRQTRQTK